MNKKKKSFIQRAKKFGKSGRFGQGRQIDRDTYDYFIRVMENMREGSFQGEDDKEAEDMFVANVFSQTEGDEVRLCGNQLASRVIEKLLPKAELATRRRFMEALVQDLRITCTDAFASHILELLMTMTSFNNQETDPEFKSFAAVWMVRVSKFVTNNLAEFAFDPYACHIIRTAFQCMSGCKVSEEILRSKKSRSQAGQASNDLTAELATEPQNQEECDNLLQDACRRILEVEDKELFLTNDLSSGILQALMTVLNKSKRRSDFKKLCLGLIEAFPEKGCNNSDQDEHYFFENEPFCRTLEVMLLNCQDYPKIYSKVHKMYFSGSLGKLYKHPVANFTVQKLIHSCPDKEKFEKMYEEELDDNIEDILASGNSGVVLSIAQTCRRLSAKQSHFLVALMKGFHCYEPSNHQNQITNLIANMMTREAIQESEESCHVHINGSLMLQELLNFQKPIKVVQSLLAMSPSKLRSLLSDPKGSHITDAFMSSLTVGEKSREGLIKSLQGELVNLACSKHGSRSMEAIWKKSSLKCKEMLASELSQKESKLNGDLFGKFLSSNFALSLYKRNKEEWKKNLDKTKRKAEMFRDILDIKPEKVPDQVEEGPKPKKAKKAKAKSYLDDL